MSHELTNRKRQISINTFVYPKILQLAYCFDWLPKGTVLRRVDVYEELEDKEWEKTKTNWKGGYKANDFQFVLADDAIELGEAVEKAMKSLLNEDLDGKPVDHVTITLTSESPQNALEQALLVPVETDITQGDLTELVKEFSGEQDMLQEFVDFCKEGEFQIS